MRLPALIVVGFLAACDAPVPKPVVDAGVFDAGVVDAGGAMDAGVVDRKLGVHLSGDGGALEFRIFSAHATRLELSLYRTASQAAAVYSAPLVAGADGVFWADVPLQLVGGLAQPLFYGYRAWGPNWPYDAAWTPGSLTGFLQEVDAAGNRFNPNKLLIDPYALELSHDPQRPGALDGRVYNTDAAWRATDTGPLAPKGVVMFAGPPAGAGPTRGLHDDVIYEVHVRGLSKNDAAVPAALRGTFAGAALLAPKLAALGVTAIEFLPVQETQNDTNEVDPDSNGGDNYWGYSTLGFFAPDRRYAADQSPGGPTREFKAMVQAFHEAGLKVFIDVVYNHTGEHGLMSWRGLDNPSYYSLTADKQRSMNNTGVAGNVNTYNPDAQAMIVDSLAYWHTVLGVDGFRFDLASVLGNACEHGCFRYDRDDPKTALNAISRRLPSAALIAEPWAIGAGTYQLGNFPKGWAEWNGSYRDTVRSVQNKLGVEVTTLAQLTARLTGSRDLFGTKAPGASVNFVVSHDGFTLADLYACDAKNNTQAWPYGPSDGGEDNNRSWNQGGVAADQRRAARTGLGLLLLSSGSAMILGGDERLRSVRCNNNSYNLDSLATWLDWMPTPEQAAFETFTERLLAFRRAHPALHPLGWYRDTDENGNGLQQLRWFQPSGAVADGAYLGNVNNHSVGWRIDGSELGEAGALYVAYNGWSGTVDFTLPSPGANVTWHLVGDTCSATEGPDQLALPGQEVSLGGMGTVRSVCPRGLAILIAK